MPCPIDTKPRWERRKDARPQELLEAAIDLFVERGYAATRLEDVARRAGVSKGTLYLYYENKDELFKAVVRGSIVPVIGEAEASVSGIIKLVTAEAGNFPELASFYQEEVINRGTRATASMLERGIARGEFRTI